MPKKKIRNEIDLINELNNTDPSFNDSSHYIISTYYIFNQPELNKLAHAARNVYNESTYLARKLLKKGQLVQRSVIEAELKRQNKFKQNTLFDSMYNHQNVQEVVKQVIRNFKAYAKAKKAYQKNPKRFSGRPKLPKCINRHTKRHTFRMSNQALRIKAGYLVNKKLKFKLKIDPALADYHLMSTLFVPIHNGFKVCVCFKIPARAFQRDNGKYISIDPGVDNAFVCVTNQAIKPIIIKGHNLMSANQYYYKRKAQLQAKLAQSHELETIIKTKQGLKPIYAQSKRMARLDFKHSRKVDLFVYKAIKRIVNYALSCNAKIVFIGKNKNWKKKPSLRKDTKQNFLGIPHAIIIQKLQAKLALYGIRLIATNESYTSQTSFLDHEQPVWANGNKSRQQKGLVPIKRRLKRGLFQSNHYLLINSDVNGALQIMKKGYQKWLKASHLKHLQAFPKLSFGNGIEGAVLHPVKLNCLI